MDDFQAYMFLFNDSLFTSLVFVPRFALAADVMVGVGGYNSYLVFIVSYIASMIGFILNWVFGTFVRKLERTKTLSYRIETFQKAEAFFNKQGKWILLLAAIPFWGPLFAVSAGILRYRLFHFLILVGFSKFIGLAISIFF